MTTLIIIFFLVGFLFFVFAEIELQKANRDKVRAEEILSEIARAHDDTTRMYQEMFPVRGQRDLEKLADLVCGVEEDRSM